MSKQEPLCLMPLGIFSSELNVPTITRVRILYLFFMYLIMKEFYILFCVLKKLFMEETVKLMDRGTNLDKDHG